METGVLLMELERLIAEVIKKGPVTLSETTTAQDVNGWDSLTNMLIVTAIEKKYNIHFGLREIVKMKCVGDICTTIQTKLG